MYHGPGTSIDDFVTRVEQLLARKASAKSSFFTLHKVRALTQFPLMMAAICDCPPNARPQGPAFVAAVLKIQAVRFQHNPRSTYLSNALSALERWIDVAAPPPVSWTGPHYDAILELLVRVQRLSVLCHRLAHYYFDVKEVMLRRCPFVLACRAAMMVALTPHASSRLRSKIPLSSVNSRVRRRH